MFDTSGIELNLNSLRFPAAGLRFRSLQAFSTESWKCCNCMWRAPLMPSNYAFIYVQNAFQKQSSRGFVMMWTPARVAGILAIGMTRLDKRSPGFSIKLATCTSIAHASDMLDYAKNNLSHRPARATASPESQTNDTFRRRKQSFITK